MISRRTTAVLAAAALAAYAVLLVAANSWIAGGSDSSGYLNEARLLARRKVSEGIGALALLELPAGDDEAGVFIPLGYRAGPLPGTMVPTYPPGLPLHMALLGAIGGWNAAPFLAGPIAAVASLLLLFGVARELGLSRGLAACGAVILAVSPIFLGMAIQPMSDVPATAWVLAAIYFALRARRRPAWAVAAGAAFGVAVLVRPTNALALIPLLLALPAERGPILRAMAGGAPFAAFLLLFNDAAFGSALETGYSGMLRRTMSPAHVLPQIRHFGLWLPALLTPLLPIAWLGIGFDRRVARRDRALLVTWFGVFLLFYCFYELYDDWWSVRFLLPGIPAIVLAALLAARDIRLAARPKRLLGIAALAAVVLVSAAWIARFQLLGMARGDVVYRDASRRAARFVPSRSLIAAMQMSGALKYYADRPILRWDYTSPAKFADLRRRAAERGVALYALLWPFEVAEFEKHLPGDWQPVGRWRDVVLYRLD
ncbi:MAG TPA: glycosyltransferase family 39 protein [Thermoanaerobaculia bacterium]|nr:glycosyltransferase family 39 protein [Thermoanaerobaculia bacterium]